MGVTSAFRGFLFSRRRRKKKMATTSKIMRTTPPAAPPAMAATLVVDLDLLGTDPVLGDGLFEVELLCPVG